MPHFNSTKILGDLKVTGLTDLYEVGSFTLKGQLNSSLPNGTAPFVIASSTLVNNLNVQYLNGLDGAHYLSWTNTTNKPSPVITLGGDLSGSVTLTSLGNGTLNATINANSVALGTDTTGNYVATVGSITNGGLTINNSGTENAAVTIGHSNIITAGTRSGSSGAIGFGGTISIPSITYDVNGHITSTTTTSVTLPTPVYPPEADTLATVTTRGNTTTNTIATARQTITQNMISGTTSAFTNPHLKLAAGDTVDATGFVGMTFATSSSDNYGFSVGALRSTNGNGSFVIRNHNNSASGTEIFRLDSSGNLTVPGKMTVSETEVSSTSNGVLFEGSVADDFEGLLKAGVLSADRTYTLPDASGTVALTSSLHNRSHTMTSTSDHTAGNWKVFYSNASGQVIELGLGSDGQVLKSNGATSAPSWQADSNTWNANSKSVAGYVAAPGAVANKVWKTDDSGNPAWRDDSHVDSASFNNGNTLTLGRNGSLSDLTAVLPDTFVNSTDGQSNLPYKGSIVIYGDSNKYYPVHFAKGNQDLLRTIKIWRAYYLQAPPDWYSSTHKGSLNLEWKGNYGGWGGAAYRQWIYENSSEYTTLLAETQLVDNSYAIAFFLRGGGTTGALYNFASDQPLTWTDSYLTYTEPTAFYSQDLTFDNPDHARYAPAPRTTVNTSQLDSITVVKGALLNSKVANYLPLSGGTLTGSLSVQSNILLTGPGTATDQGRMIDFTGFDKEGPTDSSDRAYIQHTVNAAGHTGSVLVISSQNDAEDGIGFLTNTSSQIKHNGYMMYDAGNISEGTKAEITTGTETALRLFAPKTIKDAILELSDIDSNNYLTGVSGSGNGTVTFTRSGGLGDLTWDAGHTHVKADITDFAHNHDDLYFTETESDERYLGKVGTQQITGGHGSTVLKLYYDDASAANRATLSLWASEPGITYHGTGIGYNIVTRPYGTNNAGGVIDTNYDASWIRFLRGEVLIGQRLTNYTLRESKLLDNNGYLYEGSNRVYSAGNRPAFTGATSSANGSSGFVPQPLTANDDDLKFLKGDGTWAVPTNTWNANTATVAGYVASPASATYKVWKTNASGVPGWNDAHPSDFGVQAKNTFLAGHITTASSIPTFRTITSLDLPDASASTAGIVTTGAQSFNGLKEFLAGLNVGTGTTTWKIDGSSSSAFNITNSSDTVITSTSSTQFNIKPTTQSTSSTTGALKVDGGAGIAKDLFVGGKIYMNGSTYIERLIYSGTTTTSNNIGNGAFIVIHNAVASASPIPITLAIEGTYNGVNWNSLSSTTTWSMGIFTFAQSSTSYARIRGTGLNSSGNPTALSLSTTLTYTEYRCVVTSSYAFAVFKLS